jgi:peptidoglycan/xylan/chitin deacetylase (PgdA/CDA1 family)
MNVKACAAGVLLLVSWSAIAVAGSLQHQADESYLIALIQSRARVCGIQFDDGHISNYEVGVPILRSYGLIGSFGIVTGNTDVSPDAVTTAQLHEMVSYGYHFQDHTRHHNAAFWGDPVNAPSWGADCLFSQSVFAGVGIAPMRAWNQPGGTGEGFSSALRDTLKAYGYTYAAGRVGLNNHQFRNMHFGAIDDPFSWGRWVFSWTYNGPASGWTWQAELAAVKKAYVEAWAVGGFPIVVFHRLDNANDGAAQGLDALCAWLVASGAVVLGMDDLVALAQLDRSYQNGQNIAASPHVDMDGNDHPDGYDQYVFMDMLGNANNGAGTTFYGTPPGRLVVTATIRTPLQTGAADDFAAAYQRYVIDPVTWEYSLLGPELRSHTIHQGETLTLTDTLLIDTRVDRVKFWIQAINQQPFVIENVTAVPLADPTGVPQRTPRAAVAMTVQPNPVGGAATISFHLDERVPVSVAIYDVRGRLVTRLADRQQLAGDVRMTWRASGLASGIYFARLTAGKTVSARKLVLMR